MLRRSGLSLGQYFLRRKNRAGFSWYLNKTKMSRPIQARRLEGLDKNVWVEFVKLAATYPAVNLGQGFPDLPPPDFVKEAFVKAVGGENIMLHQYTRVFVILIEPYFDCYEPMVKMAGGTPVFVQLRPKAAGAGKLMSSGDWQLDPAELASRFTKRTKAIVLNSPNNPLGKVFRREEMEFIADLCVKHDVLCFSDEVYEWLVYDGKEHIRIASLPGMWDRTITIGSAGKTFSTTGWKVGWTLGPDHLLKHLRTVHQNAVYHCPTAAQEAVAQAFQRELDHYGKPDSYFVQLAQEMQQKRDWLVQSLIAGGMKPIIPEGTYFMMADYSELKSEVPDLPDSEEPYDSRFIKWMIKNKGLVAIPVSAFYGTPHKRNFDHLIRFCFVKEEATLKAADDILRRWRLEKTGP
ncbi:kynurenine--oxoglutarate transaminase 1 isoform X4 [Pelodiscus sinensis]|uniref:kynurenine--oxoglutarate transaminase 1 isoform X4 n=1 Tax=Pelodiscus sinensis TaxID=13735 RepID=UPI003F6AAA2F